MRNLIKVTRDKASLKLFSKVSRGSFAVLIDFLYAGCLYAGCLYAGCLYAGCLYAFMYLIVSSRANVIKLFAIVLYEFCNKLECFVPGELF